MENKTEKTKPTKRKISATVSKEASTEAQANTQNLESRDEALPNAEDGNKETVQKLDPNKLTPAGAAIALIEGVDLAQKAGIYTLEDAEILAAAKRIMLGAIKFSENNG